MKLFIIAAAFLAFGMAARASDGAEKPKKPVVCVSYEVLRPGLAVCSDTKKPFLMRSFVEVVVPREEVPIKALVGWR